MKTSVKIAITSTIATVLAALIPVVISMVNDKNDKNENKSVKDSRNVIMENITTDKGDVIIDGTKITNTQVLSESRNSETKQKIELDSSLCTE